MKREQTKAYIGLLVYAIALALCAFAIGACKGIQGAVIGGGVGAASGTPQGIGVGAGAGFVVGLWEDITTAVSHWWDSLWGIPAVPPPSQSASIWGWLLGLIALGFAIKFIYHFIWDSEFRDHLFQFVRTTFRLKPKRKALHADPAP